MTRIQSIKKYKLFNKFRRFSIIVILLIGLTSLLPNLFFRDFLKKINDYSNIIIAVLTLILVSATIFYAWITYKMLDEMVESRKSIIRPILWISLGNPEIIIEKERNSIELTNKIEVSNFGRGTAINTQVKVSIPYEDGDKKRPGNYVESNLNRPLPEQFTSGAIKENAVKFYTKFYDLRKYKKEFLKIEIKYEDIERNLYSVFINYDLNTYFVYDETKGASFFWSLANEEIYLLPFSDRKYITDFSELNSIESGESMAKLIFKRRRKWDFR